MDGTLSLHISLWICSTFIAPVKFLVIYGKCITLNHLFLVFMATLPKCCWSFLNMFLNFGFSYSFPALNHIIKLWSPPISLLQSPLPSTKAVLLQHYIEDLSLGLLTMQPLSLIPSTCFLLCMSNVSCLSSLPRIFMFYSHCHLIVTDWTTT